jgi:hypothetical protein
MRTDHTTARDQRVATLMAGYVAAGAEDATALDRAIQAEERLTDRLYRPAADAQARNVVQMHEGP